MVDILFPFIFFSLTNASNYDRVLENLQKLALQNSSTTELITIGNSDSGLPIYGLKIGNGATNTLVVATHHGNEYGSTSVGLGVAESLSNSPISDQTVYVIPVLNISGFNSRYRYEKDQKSRYQDPNRDYPGPCVVGSSFNLKSTASLAKFVEEKNIITSATLHTFAPSVLYPWGLSTRDTSTLDQSTYVDLVRVSTKESGYDYGNSTELLYAADGTFEDYVYWKHGVWSLLFELGHSHNPSQSAIKEMIRVNVPGIRAFLETAPKTRSSQHQFTGQCDKNVRQRTKLE